MHKAHPMASIAACHSPGAQVTAARLFFGPSHYILVSAALNYHVATLCCIVLASRSLTALCLHLSAISFAVQSPQEVLLVACISGRRVQRFSQLRLGCLWLWLTGQPWACAAHVESGISVGTFWC